MWAPFRYDWETQWLEEGGARSLRLAPNLLRDPTHLRASLADALAFRDAMLGLHDVARSELFVPAPEVERRAQDPVITVSAHTVFFEAFSLDEATYGRLTLRHGAWKTVERLSPGCTNVDFGPKLRLCLEQMRASDRPILEVDPEGLGVHTDERSHREERIELPDGWVHGFLAVQSSLRKPGTVLTLHPGDFRNLVTYLKGRKETVRPRSLRFKCVPQAPPEVWVEPWNERIVFERSEHEARETTEIRCWGRRRLLLLQRLLPAAQRLHVVLQGTGHPSFWTVDMGTSSFLLGLSPWSDRDWTGDAMALGAMPECSEAEVATAAASLAPGAALLVEQVAHAAGMGLPDAMRILDGLCARGRVLFDPETELYFPRRLFEGSPPLPPTPWERRHAAEGLVEQKKVKVAARRAEGDLRWFEGRVQGRGAYDVRVAVDPEGRIKWGQCGCPFFLRFSFQRGPCKHLLAMALEADATPSTRV